VQRRAVLLTGLLVGTAFALASLATRAPIPPPPAYDASARGGDITQQSADARSDTTAVLRIAERLPEAKATTSAERNVRTTETLVASLGASDPLVVLEAADTLAAREITSALPALVAVDVARSPNAAPSVIAAIGRLAGVAEPAARRNGTDRLLELLAQERVRKAPEAAGNVLAVYSALGQTLDARAATALEGELQDTRVSLAAKTTVVEALAQLGQPSSRPVLSALVRELSARTEPDPLEEEIRRELRAAVERTLLSL
jgi:hypothetical protein